MLAPVKTLELALLSAAVLGFRHGFDYDHIAAITDITSLETSPPRAMRMGLLYVLGHAATVAVLGGAVITFQKSLPARIDGWAERAVGLTLVVLGLYVLGSMLRQKESFRPRSRAALMIGGFRWLRRKAIVLSRKFGAALLGSRSLPARAGSPVGGYGFNPEIENTRFLGGRSFSSDSKPSETAGALAPEAASTDPAEPYSKRSVFAIGVIHGLGAETPSQLLLFLLAANLGGLARGFLGLGMFLAGLVVMNTLMTASAVGIFGFSAAKPRMLRFVIGFTAAYSLVVGAIFLFGSSALLPPLGG
ncbi:MAG TPA: hypothetical protein VKS44_11445 [Candidatus Acidoferrales bacterium]|nr:hypothetical protein [Candidatus Acidoferrales bacterium]